MIAQLRGTVSKIQNSLVVIDVNGVGYEVNCTASCLASLKLQKEAQVIIYMDVKADSLRLYGFIEELEKKLFILLLSVKGVGARTASDIVSTVNARELLRAIANNDLARIWSVKGIGKKTAERIVLELRDKVSDIASSGAAGLLVERLVYEPFEEALQALQSLGFQRLEAERAVEQAKLAGLKADADSGAIVRESLRFV